MGVYNITIDITQQTAEALIELDNRYFFDLFKPIRENEDEEYKYRDAIYEVAQKIKHTGRKENE
ncbi:hypothetical protein FJR45_03025 [Sulfurimonas sediminis]|uniref:Uncharacterized protein n=1 Tax=Sulfurimonas sediminis TaxID=2590020 RepID=A0A7M1B2P2_9BACT|nr:hypothetical protein [Sulfurimonas sediminis]QOP42978.1 hypothetical protein FJR45_03025 [Sulfurimonas sediminis]